MFMYESDKLGFRLLWILCVCGAITLFLVQVYDRAQTYFNYKTNTNVEVVYVSEVSFPSVTICNQNNYRLVYNHLHIKNNKNGIVVFLYSLKMKYMYTIYCCSEILITFLLLE